MMADLLAATSDFRTRSNTARSESRWKEWALLQADKIDPIATGQIWSDVNDSQPVSKGDA